MEQKRKSSGLKRAIGLIVFLSLLGGAAVWYKSYNSATLPEAATKTIVEVKVGNIEDTVTAQGTLEPRQYVDVGAQVSGQLKKIYFAEGDSVKAGDLIAEIDPAIYLSRVHEDEARLKTLQSQKAEQQALVKQALQKFERRKSLYGISSVTKETLEDAQTSVEVARAQLISLDAQIEEAQYTLDADKTNLGYARILAPMDGTIVKQNVQEGQTLNASQSAPTLVQIADLDVMMVRAQVAEADIPRIKPGTPVWFTTLGAQSRKWDGTARQILPAPEVINDVVLYNVLVDADNKDHNLMTGMSTQMFFIVGKAENVPVIPRAALGRRVTDADNEKGEAYRVTKLDGKTETEVTVHIGLTDRAQAEVRDGLSPGDTIVYTAEGTAPAGSRGGSYKRAPHL